MERLLRLDRRIIFAFVLLGVTVPMLVDFDFPIRATPPVQAAYDAVERLTGAGEAPVALVCFSYGASTQPEMQPMARAILRHLFGRGVRVVVMCLWPDAHGLAQEALETTAREYGQRYGQDYVFIGYKPGGSSVLLNLGRSFRDTFPLDAWGARVDSLGLTRGIQSLGDIDLVVDLAAGDSIEYWWIPYGQEKFGFPLVAGCTAVMAPDLYPFLQSGQLDGLIGGLAGAAEYEGLVGHTGAATAGMRAQSVTHLIIVLFVLVGNAGYFLARRGKDDRGRQEAGA
jgi:hypothetical protein